MRWFLGHTAGVEGVSWEEFRARACEPHLVFGGALHEGIEQADQRLARFLPALLRDFSTGWSAVAFAVRSRQPALFGPLAAPTTARGLTRAPLGFYMLSARRLADSLPSAPLEAQRQALAIHHNAHNGEPFFCDPNLEVECDLQGGQLEYRPPRLTERLREAGRTFLSGRLQR